MNQGGGGWCWSRKERCLGVEGSAYRSTATPVGRGDGVQNSCMEAFHWVGSKTFGCRVWGGGGGGHYDRAEVTESKTERSNRPTCLLAAESPPCVVRIYL